MWAFFAGSDVTLPAAPVGPGGGNESGAGEGRLPYLFAVGPVPEMAAVTPPEQQFVRAGLPGELLPGQRARLGSGSGDMHPGGRGGPLGQRDVAFQVILRQAVDVVLAKFLQLPAHMDHLLGEVKVI